MSFVDWLHEYFWSNAIFASPIFAFTFIMGVWVLADFISKKSKSIISVMLVASLIYVPLFVFDILPANFIDTAGFVHLGNATLAVLVVHMGTMMSFENLKAQWRTYILGASVVAIGMVTLFFVGSLVFDWNTGIAGAASALGGTVNILLIQGWADGRAEGTTGMLSPVQLAVLPLLILNLKSMIGFLVTAPLLQKEAKRVVKEYRAGNIHLDTSASSKKKDQTEDEIITPKSLQTVNGTIFIIAFAGFLALAIQVLTTFDWAPMAIPMGVTALIFGVLLRHFKIVKPNAMSDTNTFGMIMLAIMIFAFGALAAITPAQIADIFRIILFFIAIAIVIIAVVALIVGKFLGLAPMMSIAMGLSAFFGFPGTMILSKGASEVGETEDEVAIIDQEVMPRMVNAGFATVTITSVLVGAILIGLLRG